MGSFPEICTDPRFPHFSSGFLAVDSCELLQLIFVAGHGIAWIFLDDTWMPAVTK